ncbi:hypothetical protein M422DRAFT_243476 [Sphaerobolus stellatus SS14]|nr:hypothetical protein M422DRAFT_243476 [Sphaerobolus stellatus SS14]
MPEEARGQSRGREGKREREGKRKVEAKMCGINGALGNTPYQSPVLISLFRPPEYGIWSGEWNNEISKTRCHENEIIMCHSLLPATSLPPIRRFLALLRHRSGLGPRMHRPRELSGSITQVPVFPLPPASHPPLPGFTSPCFQEAVWVLVCVQQRDGLWVAKVHLSTDPETTGALWIDHSGPCLPPAPCLPFTASWLYFTLDARSSGVGSGLPRSTLARIQRQPELSGSIIELGVRVYDKGLGWPVTDTKGLGWPRASLYSPGSPSPNPIRARLLLNKNLLFHAPFSSSPYRVPPPSFSPFRGIPPLSSSLLANLPSPYHPYPLSLRHIAVTNHLLAVPPLLSLLYLHAVSPCRCFTPSPHCTTSPLSLFTPSHAIASPCQHHCFPLLLPLAVWPHLTSPFLVWIHSQP